MDLKAHLGLQLVLGALTFVAVGLPAGVESARILAVLPMPAPSHHIAVSAVLKALADRGHDITFFSGLPKGNKINPTNVKTFHLDLPTETMAHDELKTFWEQTRSSFEQLLFLMDLGPFLCNVTLHNPVFKAEVNKPGQKYDLIIVETFFFQEAFVGLGLQFNVPVVTVNPFGTSPWVNEVMGNPVNPSWVPSPFLGFSDRMSFIERATNTLHFVMSHIAFNYYYIPKQDALLHEHWPDAPGIHYLLHSKLGLALVNNHFTLAYPAPVSPNVVEIGGIQIQEKVKPLPKDLQDYLDGAENGVVYFSMGSNLKLEHAPEDKRRAILDALGGLKEKVLLKWDGPDPKNISPNIRIIQWAPQADLLAHPKVRAFVTHGGLLSTQESVYHGVPVVGMPMFGDQPFNMRLAVRKGFGVLVEFKTLTKEALSAGLKEVLGNPKYKESATRLSRLFRAKQMRPVDASIWAVEHVLQHGADHLRPSSVGMPLYQLLLLDVILAAMAPLVVLVLCCRALCCRRGKSQQVSQADKRKKNK